MRYGDVLSRSWEITWRHRYLWFLAVLGGEGAGSAGNVPAGPTGSFGNAGGGQPPDFTSQEQALGDWVSAHLGLLAAIGATALVLLLALALIACIAEGALIRASAEHDSGRPYGLGPAWRAGLACFWRILGLKLVNLVVVLGLLVMVAAIVGLGILGAAGHNGLLVALAIVMVVLLLLALIPASLVWSVVLVLAARVIVLELKPPLAAIGLAFSLVRRRLGRVALTWLIYIGVGIGVGIALGIVLLIVALPFIAIVVAALTAHSTAAAVVTVGVGLLVFLAVSLVLGGAVGAYLSTYWTLAYRRLDLDPVPASAPAAA